VIPAAFDYIRPSTVEDAVDALADAGDEGKALAGGQSLLPVLRLRLAAPALLVDLGGLSQLRGIREDGDMFVIGAMTTHAELAASSVPLLSQAAATVGDRQVRHLGTLGGSLAHADPAGDLPTAAVALDAQLVVAGPNGKRTVQASDFFVDLFTTALEADEIITSVSFPAADGAGIAYEKFRHPASGYAVVGVAVKISRGADGNVDSARIAVTGATSKATRATAAEQALVGKALDDAAIDAAAAVAANGLEINGDHFASEEYRKHLIGVLTGRALRKAAA
jgi:carbon-monoxide dehydrogenase medium subunit